MLPLIAPLALIASGLGAGVLLWSAVCGVPLLARLPAEGYVRTHQFWAPRFEPFQPICVLICVVAGGLLAALAPVTAARVFFAAGAACAAAVLVVSVTRSVPIKKWVISLRPDDLPPDWDEHDPRRVWGTWNLIRTALAVAVLVANAVAVGFLL
jgi:hypothetical protein